MKRNVILLIAIISLLSVSIMVVSASPGKIDSPNSPGSTTSFTLVDLYNRLSTGNAGSSKIFTEPSVSPGTGTMHDLNEIMAVAPAIDDSDGATVTDVVSGKKFWGLTSAGWGLQTGTGSRFIIHDNGTPQNLDDDRVTDTVHALQWTRNANLPGAELNFNDAKSFCENLELGGKTNWLLPYGHLYTLMDFEPITPKLPPNHPFINVKSSQGFAFFWYWSDLQADLSTNQKWVWSFAHSGGDIVGIDETHYVWCFTGAD